MATRGSSELITVTFTKADNTPAVLTAATFTATGPEVAVQTATLLAGITNPSPGVYQAGVLLTEGGTWNWRLEGTGTGFSGAEEGIIEVDYRKWTYGGDPANDPMDAARFMLGDTDPTDPQTDDAEVAFALMQYGNNPRLAAAFLASRLAAMASRAVSITVGEIRISAAEKVTNLRILAQLLQTEEQNLQSAQVGDGVAPMVTGLLQSERYATTLDLSRRPMLFDPDQQGQVELWPLNAALFLP